ncbi:DMT family transporter [Oleiharenicola sp. Vm1]|uniref:DMT family transporter n=1 Tax=Oleiharenicola sp. Vm1 TaxID=3398393 RepID=UPI0039F4EA85
MRRPSTLPGVLLVLACFAANSLITRFLVGQRWLDPAAVTLVRFAAGAGMLAALVAARAGLRQALPRRADAPAVFALAGYALAIAYGYRFITAAAGTFVFYALVILTMTAGGGARPTRRALAGALLALVGVGVLAFGRVRGSTPLGVALLALTGATWGVYSLLLRRGGAPLAANARAFVGVAVLLPVLAWIERDALVWSPAGLALGVFMGAVTTALSYALWARLLPELSPIEAGTFQLLVPVLTAGGGVVLLGEEVSWQLGGSGALVLAGMWLTVRRGGRG